MDKITTLRIPKTMLDRVDSLIETIAEKKACEAKKFTRSKVIRMAILRGLSELEAEYEKMM